MYSVNVSMSDGVELKVEVSGPVTVTKNMIHLVAKCC